ncbi:MAG: Abi family protein [Proteobacteria bacterium]|nr:Abi family protein [Pseudomonadota bacterium]
MSAYTLPFQVDDPKHYFKQNTKFEDVLELYVFDRELRLLVLDAIERIEVAMRSYLNNHMSLTYGPHWYLDESHFTPAFAHKELLADIEKHCKRKKEIFVKHYMEKYCEPRLPPGWVVIEILTFGQLSSMYDCLSSAHDKKTIAKNFNTHAELLRSWTQSISYLRNVCAHHSRLWNRELGNAPKIPKDKNNWIQYPIVIADPNVKPSLRLYMLLAIVEYLLRAINPESSWHERLYELMQKYPNISKAHMGMPENWHDDPFWQLEGKA